MDQKSAVPTKKIVQTKLVFNSNAANNGPRFSKARQEEVDDALMQMMVAKILPLSLVENDKFLKFVELLEPRYSRNKNK